MYIVGFNGPPRCGKDTMSQMLAEHLDSRTDLPIFDVSLSMPLRRIAYAMTNWTGNLDGQNYENFKTTHFPAFGKDGRHIMIDVSESFLKQQYGQKIMAEMLLAEYRWDVPSILLVRDTGFQIEQATLAAAVGEDNFVVAHVHRVGCNFDNDSREWVFHKHTHDYDNGGTLDDLKTEAVRLYGRMVNQLGWKL